MTCRDKGRRNSLFDTSSLEQQKQIKHVLATQDFSLFRETTVDVPSPQDPLPSA